MTRPLALLVDHDRDTLDLYAHYFDLNSWHTDNATDGASALVKAVHLLPDAIVTETRLPIVDGIRLICILKSDSQTAAIPIVVVTADPCEEEWERARGAGCDAVMVKPCAPDDVVAAVIRTCERNRSSGAKSASARAHSETAIAGAVNAQVRALRLVRRRGARSVKTTEPNVRAPELHCPICSAVLVYEFSYLGGVPTHREQWDYLHCPAGCGTFQYRHRTRRLKMA